MNALDELGFIFADALAEVISKVSGVSLNNSVGYDDGFDEMIGIMNLNGKNSGVLLISAKEAALGHLCSLMIGIPEDEVTKDDVCDMLCELVNMTAGNAKLRLSNASYSFALSLPFMISGDNMALRIKKKEHIITRTLTDGKTTISIKVIHQIA